jgi:AMMECR1 domain-containing protein
MSTPFPPFPYRTLAAGLTDGERRRVEGSLRSLLRFQRTLDGWAKVRRAPDATPFVSLYAGPTLRGCYGSDEGGPAERLMRAFLRAQHDARFGGIAPADRSALAAQVAYPRAARLVDPERAAEEIAPGTHGVALVRDRQGSPGSGRTVLLLPHVARDEGLAAPALVQALFHKAGADADDHGGALYVFETEDVTVHPEEPSGRAARRGVAPRTAADLAAAWLASLIDAEGRVTFAVDARARRRSQSGPMAHGRAAVVVQALAAHGRHPGVVGRARRWLEHEVRSALAGARAPDWPDDPAMVAGTLALAVLAGVQVVADLEAHARGAAKARLVQEPWHAAQVVAALGARAPDDLWSACVANLDARPWAPWTVMAASARGDRAVRARAARTVADALRPEPPHRGGASVTPVPETALTALSVEALAHHPAPWARAAAARGLAFLESIQLVGPRLYGALDPSLARGAFPATPVHSLLRGDVTGHALLAMLTAP